MHGTIGDRRALEREALKNVIAQWNANRLDIFELSEPNEDLEFHGVMRFYFQDSGQKVATKCIRVASDATVEDVIGTLVEKFRPDMRMLSVPSYALYELHEHCPERKMEPDEKPLLVQLNWHVDDREGRFLLKNVDDKTSHSVGLSDSNASFRRKLSKREKKQLKKQEKLSRLKSENGDEKHDGVAEKLYTELPETSFTRSISNPEAVMRRRRQQKLERKLQQFRSKDGGPDTGGTLKIYGEALCKDVPYKTLLLSIRDTAGSVVREMLEKYGLHRVDPSQFCLVQVSQQPGVPDAEYILDEDECPLSILMNSPNTGSIMFHVRRRPADCAPRKRKKKPGALGTNASNSRDPRGDSVPILIELGPDGSAPLPGDTARTIRLNNDVMEVGSANGIALQLYGPHIQPRHCVITNTDGVTSLTPCHADAYTYVNGQRIHQTTILTHGSLIKFGHSNTYRFLDPSQEDRPRRPSINDTTGARIYDRSPRALSPIEGRENFETTFDLEGNVETVSTASGAREDNRSLGSSSENRLSGIDRYPRGQDPILPAVLEFPEEPQEQFLARVITHLDVSTPTFRLAPAYTLYLCARYRASTHYRPELTPTERAQKLTLLLQHAAMLIRHTIQDRSTESSSQAFWLANASELLHFLKSDRHVSAFSVSAQETLADSVQLSFKNLVACLTDELNSVMGNLMSDTSDDHPREVINVLSGAMNLIRKCRVNAALTIQLFSQLFHWISARSLSTIINNSHLCTRLFGMKLFNRLRNLQAWAESQGLEFAAECHLAKIVQCAHLLQAPKYTAEELANLSPTCFKLNSLQLRALLTQYKGDVGEQLASGQLLEQAARAAEGVADELTRAEGREVRLHEDPAPPLQLLLPDDGFSCDVVQGVPSGLADFLHPLQASGLCRLAAQPTSSGHWTVYMSAPRPPSALSTTQPEVQIIRLHKAGGGMGLSIVAAKGAGQERLGIYIKSVVPGGAADRDGRLAAGDQLLSVDGQSLLGITQEKAAEFLVRTGNVVTLEVAKGGAVYHGLATLLQQPSPTPHRAWDSPDRYPYNNSSQESLYSYNNKNRIYTPPVTKPKNNVFFNSDDNLYKTEMRKLTIPRIEIEQSEPIFRVEITDFSEPNPTNVTLCGEIDTIKEQQQTTTPSTKSWKNKTNNYVQQKSFSLDVKDVPFIDADFDQYLNTKTFKSYSTSLQDLSSSTSSLNSGVHESNLDLSQDTPTKEKNWKSPNEYRFGHVKILTKRFEDIFGDRIVLSATSYPNLTTIIKNDRKNRSYERLTNVHEKNNKLSDFEKMELIKVLQDWSLNGSSGGKDYYLLNNRNNEKRKSRGGSIKKQKALEVLSDECLDKIDVTRKNDFRQAYSKYFKTNLDLNLNNQTYGGGLKCSKTYNSEPDLLLKKQEDQQQRPIFIMKYKSDSNLNSRNSDDSQFYHDCKFRNCIFNKKFTNNDNGTNNYAEEFLNNDSDEFTKKFNNLKRFGSLERLNNNNNEIRKKFPESYVIRRCNTADETTMRTNNHKVIVRRKCMGKTWKSCSDLKRQRVIQKCCKNAKKTCPILKETAKTTDERKTQSCDNFDDSCEKLLKERSLEMFDENRPRRMSERDLPSKVDSERTIPSSKSVPALHHISPGSDVQRNTHDVFNPGYSRTSSNNSINTNGAVPVTQNGPGIINQNNNVRSRSTHNLNQQDSGFYQNLSVYRNKMPSPQHLGDRSSALRSSQNSLQSSVTSSQRPSSAYYPHTSQVNRPNLHQSIPNLKSAPSTQRIQNEEAAARSGSYPSVNQQHYHQNQYAEQQQQHPSPNMQYQSQNYPSQNYNLQNFPRTIDENKQYTYNLLPRMGDVNSYPSPNHGLVYGNNLHQPLHINANGQRLEETGSRYNSAGLLREDIARHTQSGKNEETLRYPNTNNARIQEAQIQANKLHDDFNRNSEMRTSKSEDLLRQHTQIDMMKYASSGNIRTQESSKIDLPQLRLSQDERINAGNNTIRGTAKMMEMGEEVRRRQSRPAVQQQQSYQHLPTNNVFYQQQQPPQSYYTQQHYNNQLIYNQTHSQNTHNLQNLNLNQNYPQQQQQQNSPYAQNTPYSQQNYYSNTPTSPNYVKSPPIAPKPSHKGDLPPELPPTSTHPLYSSNVTTSANTTPTTTSSNNNKQELLTSILKPGTTLATSNNVNNPVPPPEPQAPPPPERGSSYAVMSMRNKEGTKRVSFNDASAVPTPPNNLQIEDIVREDPNSFIRQAESMLASPTTPTDSPGVSTVTPGVIGAQEVYKDPRAKRLAEQAQQKMVSAPIPEKLSFKEKMKMFAMETGESGTPKDKSKISRAQREIDNLGAATNPSLVH